MASNGKVTMNSAVIGGECEIQGTLNGGKIKGSELHCDGLYIEEKKYGFTESTLTSNLITTEDRYVITGFKDGPYPSVIISEIDIDVSVSIPTYVISGDAEKGYSIIETGDTKTVSGSGSLGSFGYGYVSDTDFLKGQNVKVVTGNTKKTTQIKYLGLILNESEENV